MNPKILPGLAVAATLFISLRLDASGNERRKELSSTRRVVIDGRSFAPDESSSDEGSLLRREIGRLGIRIPDGFNLPGDAGSSHPAFSRRLKDSRPRLLETPRLPAGLTVEHTLRMEGEGTPVDLVFGKLGTPGPSVRYRLLSSGWDSVSAVKDPPGGIHVLQTTRGKETTVVCLDEAEGAFLLIREVGR